MQGRLQGLSPERKTAGFPRPFSAPRRSHEINYLRHSNPGTGLGAIGTDEDGSVMVQDSKANRPFNSAIPVYIAWNSPRGLCS
ncbi:hypothetical protein SSKA14_1913 [Stenotrophomonas sp. SKA14]|nr:hypothetical protein SSKA14_1913 [Stenotrophomonas sp. SKA14]